jgi:large subunit ribosomal protein L25
MKTVSLSGSPRENVGKKDAKSLREKGHFPCVLYGGKEQVHFSLEEIGFDKVLFTPDVYIIELTIGDNKHKAVIQDLQYHPVTDKVLHVDFLEVFDDKPIKVALPVKSTGNAPGVIKGGRLVQSLRKLKVKGLIKDLPETITIDISKLNIGDTKKVEDIELENVEFLDVPSQVVYAVRTTRVTTPEEEEEEEESEGEGEGGEEKPAETSE